MSLVFPGLDAYHLRAVVSAKGVGRVSLMGVVVMVVMMLMTGGRVMVVMPPGAIAGQLPVFAAIAGHESRTCLALPDALLQQVEDLLLETEIGALGKTQARILPSQVLHLALDALHQAAGKELVGQDDDLGHAQ